LLINQNGTDFEEIAVNYGVEDPFNGMGLAQSDIDNNGDFELMVTNIKENGFYMQTDGNAYSNQSQSLGIYDTGWAWGVSFSDFNQDGYEDLFIANGFEDRIAPNCFFKNISTNIGRKFEKENLTSQNTIASNSRSTVSFDYDNDGDLDLIVTNFDDHPFLYENTSVDTYFTKEISGAWLKVKLEGVVSNKNAFGSKVELYTDNDLEQFRFYHGAAYQSQSIQPIHFGVSNATVADSIVVTWPSGVREIHENIQINSTIKIIEGSFYTIENNNTAVKIPGCTNKESCGYNPKATVSDGSCAFLNSGVISGNFTPNPLNTETYSYSPSIGDLHDWEVVNGKIISGQGTNKITVLWDIAVQGTISVTNRNNICSSEMISFNVALDLPDGNDRNNDYSIARLWNEVLLEAIRKDFARPTIHARNLFHTSIAMYDAWAIHNKQAETYFIGKELNGFKSELNVFEVPEDKTQSINKTISYATYNLLKHRFKNSPNAEKTQSTFDDLMSLLNYDMDFKSTDYSSGSSAALGNYIAEKIIEYGLQDGSNEVNGYDNLYYKPVNEPMIPIIGGNNTIIDPNRWQPLSLDVFIDQSGNVRDETIPEFLSPE